MEQESETLCNFVRQEMFASKTALALDIHSGFGKIDRLWYPYAKTTAPFPEEKKAKRITKLLDNTYPHHVYRIEPQSANYLAHGDLWDYLYDGHLATSKQQGRVFIPWTLELGSWLWVRKNPLQAFEKLGLFDPVLPHRRKRVLRRHLLLLNFFLKCVLNSEQWL